MKPMTFNMSKVKKIASDEHSSTFLHPDGHKFVVAHGPLKPIQRKQIEMMPVHKYADGTPNQPVSADDGADQISDKDAQYAQAIQEGREQAEKTGNAIISKLFTPIGQAPQSPDYVPPAPSGAPTATEAATPPTATEAATPPSQPGGLIPMGVNSDIEKYYPGAQQAITNQAGLEAQKAQGTQEALQNDLQKRQDLVMTAQEDHAAFKEQQHNFMQDYMNDHINPNSYLENMSVPQRIATAIGLFLGGAGAHSTGGVNPAAQFLSNQIDRNIDAQKNRQGQFKTLLEANQSLYHDDLLAQNQTRVNMNDMLDHQIQLEAAKLGTPQAKDNAALAHLKLATQSNGLLQQNALRSALLKQEASGAHNTGPNQNVNYDKMNLLQKTDYMPEPDVSAATKEAQTYENHVQQVGTVLNSFEQANKDNTITGRAEHLGAEPASVTALKTSLLPYLKDAEGRINEQELARTDGFIPLPGDGPQKIVEKRQALQQFLAEKNSPQSFPTLRRYGLINAHQSVAAPQANSLEGKTASDAKGNRIVMKNGKWVPVGQ